MRKQYILYSIFFLSLFITSCQKDDLNGASGQIIDAATQEGVPNADVILYLAETPIFGPTQVTFVEEARTDAEGFYTFDSDIKRNETYKVSVSAETYYQNNLVSYPSNKIVEMTPESIVQLHIKNLPPTHSLDRISVSNTFEGGGGGPFYGPGIDTIVSGTVRGNRDVRIIWFVTNAGGEDVSNNETVFAEGHDTINFEIIY